jgi:phosphatidylglycerol---prolipoprotein diacylglyceryl transferase
MHPILTVFEIPRLGWLIRVQAYPLAHLLALLAFGSLTLWIYRRDVGPPWAALDALLAGCAGGLVGAVLLGALTAGTLFDVHRDALWGGNRSAYGGLLLGTAAAYVAARRRRVPVGALFDAAAPGLALGAFLCRIGCFLGGCCWGRATRSIFGLRFPADHPGMLRLPAGAGWGLLPTQLYLAAAALLTALVVLDLRRRAVGRSGDRFLVASALYAAGVLYIEFLRGDPHRWFAFGLSHSQWISIAVLFAVTAAAATRIVRARRDVARRLFAWGKG